jgi:type III secretion protein U
MSERTEQPTPKRLAEARRRGEVPASRDLTGAAALLGGLVALAATGPWLAGELASLVRCALREATRGDPTTVGALGSAALAVARCSFAPALAATAAAALAGALQSGFLFAPEVLAPRLERLDPARGLGRLCSAGRLGALLLGLLKAALAGALAVGWARSAGPSLRALPSALDPWTAGAALLRPLALRLVALVVLFGLADLVLARWRHRRGLLMTRDEIRREAREEEEIGRASCRDRVSNEV